MKFKWLKKVFNRNFLVFLILFVQALFILTFFFKLNDYSSLIYGAQTVLSVILVAYVINREETNPAYKLSWSIVVMLIPIVGAFLYIFFHSQLGRTSFYEKKNKVIRNTASLIPQNPYVLDALTDENVEQGRLAWYISRYGGYPVYRNTDMKYFSTGEEKFRALLNELRKAKRYIFMEYFIIDEGEMLREVLSVLEQKVREGVEVRILYDGMGTQIHRPGKFKRMIEEKGIRCRVFNTFRPFLTSAQNNRDHRKIVSIDGMIAFTGGINIADEYINRVNRFGHWKDTGIMIKGEAAWSFTVMFLQMWDFKSKKLADYERFFPDDPSVMFPKSFDGYIQPYGDSPTTNEQTGKQVYLDIINKAKEHLYITTPYFIVDNEIMTALIFSAKSGVDVKIIVPHIPDKRYVNVLGWNYYQELTKHGVRVFEYMPGFIHAKNFESDDRTAVVGTINLDYRSLYLHFECAAVMYGTSAVADIKLDFLNTLARSREITLKDCQKRPLLTKIASGFLRMIAPML